MGDLKDIDLHMKEPLPSENGNIDYHLIGLENPAFRSVGPTAVSSYSLTNGELANHLIYDTRRSKKAQPSRTFLSEFYGQNDGYINPYATTPKPMVHSDDIDHTLRQSQTMGRKAMSSGYTQTSAYDLAVSKRPWSTGQLPSGQQAKDKKQNCISYFDIETNKVSSYIYRPGEEVTGDINIYVRKSLEIRFVELVVIGQGHVTLRRSSEEIPRTTKETYLRKQKYIIGSDDPTWSSVLTPGHYTSKFRVVLPHGLPSTLHHTDVKNGLTFDITYLLKVRICDDIGLVSRRANRVRVFMEKQILFNVQRSFDLSSIPDALSVVTHTEQVYLACTHQEAAVVSVTMERAVFLAGDDIRVRVQVSLPQSQKVKDITCALIKIVALNSRQEPAELTLSKIIRTDEQDLSERQHVYMYDICLPTATDLMSPYSLGVSHVQLNYHLHVTLRFRPVGGKLSFKVPVGVGPCAEPIYAEKISSRKAVPLFNRATRFPCFSSRSLTTAIDDRPSTTRSNASVTVTTNYSNGLFARGFLCCLGVTD